MPRARRRVSCTGFYHIVVRGINREKIFNQQREKIYFKKIIYECLSKYEAEIYAYCIMSNHAHFIIRAEIQVLSAFMSRILSEYALYYNFKHDRNGHVFQNRFHSECIEDNAYYWNCVRYIHMNPVKAKIVKYPLKYKFGSMAEYSVGEAQMVHLNALKKYWAQFPAFEEFEKFHQKQPTQIFYDIKTDMEKQQQEIALYYAEEMSFEKQLDSPIQIYEEKSIREEYIMQIMKILKVSRRKAERLCETIMRNKMDKK